MSPEMLLTLYLGPALTLALLRLQRGHDLGESLLAGIIWPLEIPLAGIEACLSGLDAGATAEQWEG